MEDVVKRTQVYIFDCFGNRYPVDIDLDSPDIMYAKVTVTEDGDECLSVTKSEGMRGRLKMVYFPVPALENVFPPEKDVAYCIISNGTWRVDRETWMGRRSASSYVEMLRNFETSRHMMEER